MAKGASPTLQRQLLINLSGCWHAVSSGRVVARSWISPFDEWILVSTRKAGLSPGSCPLAIFSSEANLKLARLPIPPHPRVDSSDWTRESRLAWHLKIVSDQGVLDEPSRAVVGLTTL